MYVFELFCLVVLVILIVVIFELFILLIVYLNFVFIGLLKKNIFFLLVLLEFLSKLVKVLVELFEYL